MKKKLIAALVVVALVISAIFTLVACDNTKKITIWVSETDGVKSATEKKVKEFIAAHPEYESYQVAVQGVTESEAATNMVTDVATGADIFCFAQDQLGRLYEANALSKLGTAGKEAVNKNDTGSIQAVTIGGDMYAYPITSDNTYVMYYNKRVINEDIVGNLNDIVAACEAAGKNISFEVGGSAWYTASFFFGAGATSSWTLNAETKKWTAADTFGSEEKGLIALKGLQVMTKSAAWVDSSKASDFTASTPSAVVVTGTWDANTAQAALGENLGVAKLPSYTVNGQNYQLTSFFGYKLMGVKNHSDLDVHAFCHELAIFLSGKDCQEDRLDKFNWGPSNKELQASEKVTGNAILAAVLEQKQVSVLQGQIHGGWWDIAKLLGSKSKDKDGQYAGDEGLKKILEEYRADIEKYENMSDEDMNAWGLIGSIASLNDGVITVKEDQLAAGQTSWASWNSDIVMVKQDDGTYKSIIAIDFAEDDAFKVRQGQSWTNAFGGGTVANDDGNYVIAASEAGKYYVVLSVTVDDAGNVTAGTVTLEAAE